MSFLESCRILKEEKKKKALRSRHKKQCRQNFFFFKGTEVGTSDRSRQYVEGRECYRNGGW